jgi:N6-L-threonylcarbamoyladenine synthase
MRILAIETSCDETAIAVVEATGLEAGESSTVFSVLGNALVSQIDMHKAYGGVFPALAKREHARNLVPVLEAALEEAQMLQEDTQAIPEKTRGKISGILSREPGLAEAFFDFVSECEPPALDVITVTSGPGLEPALWVGVNFAKALALVWEKPLVAVNHMEGHIMAALAKEMPYDPENTAPIPTRFNLVIENVEMPVLALLISGGHTELVLMREWLRYTLVGQTRDDAVGEAFDKVARMLSLPYPGGPEISRLAERERRTQTDRSQPGDVSEEGEDQSGETRPFALPRPMISEPHCDFSFSGLKTAVLYMLKRNPEMTELDQQKVAREFEDAVTEVLWKKTARALEDSGAQTLVLGGGVSANTHIRRFFTHAMNIGYPQTALRIPHASLTTDNAVMIALAGYYHACREEFVSAITANGNRSLAK